MLTLHIVNVENNADTISFPAFLPYNLPLNKECTDNLADMGFSSFPPPLPSPKPIIESERTELN